MHTKLTCSSHFSYNSEETEESMAPTQKYSYLVEYDSVVNNNLASQCFKLGIDAELTCLSHHQLNVISVCMVV